MLVMQSDSQPILLVCLLFARGFVMCTVFGHALEELLGNVLCLRAARPAAGLLLFALFF